MLSRALLLARTLPHLRPWQVAGRIIAPVRRQFTRIPEPPTKLSGRLEPRAAFPHHDPWNTREELLAGRFTFLNETARLGWLPDWNAQDKPLLWQFNLHYFHYLHVLFIEDQQELCRHWAEAYPKPHPVAWHPYPTSLRIVNWCRAGLQDAAVQRSLYRQAAYLYRNIETHVYGNHLLENARALVLAGIFFEGQGEANEWLEKGLEIYREETSEQVLDDGFHFERSPMYHALVLEGYLDVLNVLPWSDPDRVWLEATARRMTDALASVMRPDGTLPLFNDSTQEIAPAPAALLNYARRILGHEPAPRVELPHGGYFLHRTDDINLMINGGKAGPDYLMAHAHADVFSYELCIQGKPFIVDTGVYEYAEGPMRDYVRSTRAHNTVTVDGMDQIECWGSFRVAGRWKPTDVVFKSIEHGALFEGTFSGYAERIGDNIRHHRRVSVDDQERRITVEDQVEGEGTHRVESRIHLHPDVTVSRTNEGLVLQRSEESVRLSVDGVPVTQEKGSYCPRFGVRERNEVLVLGGDFELPVQMTYHLDY